MRLIIVSLALCSVKCCELHLNVMHDISRHEVEALGGLHMSLYRSLKWLAYISALNLDGSMQYVSQFHTRMTYHCYNNVNVHHQFWTADLAWH